MKHITIAGTDHHPTVDFDPSTGVMLLGGRSIPANPQEFYEPLIAWILEYAEAPKPESRMKIDLEYFNTGSSKKIWDVMRTLKKLNDAGQTDLVVEWYFDEDDEDMEEAAQEYEELMEMKFSMHPKKE